MELRKVVSLSGPNIWAPCPMLEAWVELEAMAGRLSTDVPGFNERLGVWLPLVPDPADQGATDELLPQLHVGIPPAEVLQYLTLRLQRAAAQRTAVQRGCSRETSKAGHYQVAVEFEEETLARRALASAWQMLLAAAGQGDYAPADELARLRAFADRYCLGPSTRAIVEAARKRRIPARRLNDRSLVQLGHGAQQRRIFTAETDSTSAIAEGIAQDKQLTKTLLRAVGVPVPAGRIVQDAADAWQAACEIGLPVVIKPRDANHGRGVALNLTTRQQVETAFALAVVEGEGVIVERYALGAEHRLLIVGDRMVAASRGEPEQVIGDGRHTVAELVDLLNCDPRRGLELALPLGKVELDPPGLLALEQQGYGPDSVPSAGVTVTIHANGDFTTDETDDIHPDVADHAVLAAQVIGLDVAGVDVIAPTLSRPLSEQGGVVIEVNAGPGLRMHLEPQRGQPRAVGDLIVQNMFPPGQSGRIPLVAVYGQKSALTTRLVAQLLRTAGYYVGRAGCEGVFVNDRPLETIDGTLHERHGALLLHPRLTAAVFECTASAILERGMALDECDVAIIGSTTAENRLKPGLQHELSESEFSVADEPEPGVLARVIAGSVASEGTIIVWADDPLAEQIVAASRGGTIWLTSDANHPRLVEVRRCGGCACFARENGIWFAMGGRDRPLAADGRSVTLESLAARIGWEALLATAAAGWSLGIAQHVVGTALNTLVL